MSETKVSDQVERVNHTQQPAARGASGTEAADRVADVLLLFSGGTDSLGVSTISRELGIAKAVVHRILRSLVSRQLIVPDSGGRAYRLGPAASALGARALRESGLRSAALPVLRTLRDRTGETTTLSELVGDTRVYLDQFGSPQEIKMTVEIGRRFPLHAGASSKAILAFLPESEREPVLRARLAPLTGRTVCDQEQLRAELGAIAAAGTAVSHGERQRGAASVAAPVFGMDGDVVAAISICGPVDRFGPAECREYERLVHAAGQEISRALGWGAPAPERTTLKEGT